MSNFPASTVGINYARTSIALYSTLQQYLDRKIVRAITFNSARAVTFSGTNFVKIDSTIVSGDLAVGSSSTCVSGGIVVASVAGSFATGSLEIVTNADGTIMNKVAIRDSVTNQEIRDTDNRTIWGLLQSANGVADGTAISGSGSENLRLVLFKYNATDTLALVTYTGTVEFEINKLYSLLSMPNYTFEGKSVDTDIVAQATPKTRKYIVTTAYQANEIINTTTGAGSIAGASTVSGDTITLPSSANAFNTNSAYRVFISQGYQSKGSAIQDDVTWQSATSFSANRAIDINEVIVIETI